MAFHRSLDTRTQGIDIVGIRDLVFRVRLQLGELKFAVHSVE